MEDKINYNNDMVMQFETPTDFDELGDVNITRMNGSIPFYSFTLNGGGMLTKFDKKCNGHCFNYTNKHVNWVILTGRSRDKEILDLKMRICDDNDTGIRNNLKNSLFLCLPKEGINM